jgi:hypothetical protein
MWERDPRVSGSDATVSTVAIVRFVMRRMIVWLVLVGGAALLASWPLWHVVRPDSGCGSGVPCDPGLVLPFAPLATVLTALGGLALITAAALGVALFIRGVIRLDVRDRQARQ